MNTAASKFYVRLPFVCTFRQKIYCVAMSIFLNNLYFSLMLLMNRYVHLSTNTILKMMTNINIIEFQNDSWSSSSIVNMSPLDIVMVPASSAEISILLYSLFLYGFKYTCILNVISSIMVAIIILYAIEKVTNRVNDININTFLKLFTNSQ